MFAIFSSYLCPMRQRLLSFLLLITFLVSHASSWVFSGKEMALSSKAKSFGIEKKVSGGQGYKGDLSLEEDLDENEEDERGLVGPTPTSFLHFSFENSALFFQKWIIPLEKPSNLVNLPLYIRNQVYRL